eukprot:TRINITY_DN919_c0_g2_i1.p1 TRINITY_DN919_c0_g2~~TRINITY_DN919_c0_g2_i1.p1  ORF type:complete len:302 (+),score=31.85 TRINITY_DN919_c0_g2_i1:118-1023(+)
MTQGSWFRTLSFGVAEQNKKLATFCDEWVYTDIQEAGLTTMDSMVSRPELGQCCGCSKHARLQEGVHLMCGHIDHWHCFKCLDTLVTKSIEFLFQHNFFFNDKVRQLLPGIVICSVCTHPSFLSSEIRYIADNPNQPFRLREDVTFTLDVDSTNVLTYYVESLYQNERRAFAGMFGEENLLVVDFRGAWSNEENTNYPKGRRSVKCPNASYHWITDWTIEKIPKKDNQGWEYALNWPGSGSFDRFLALRWCKIGSPTTFVRRRKWLRTRIRLSEDDLLLLEMVRSPCQYWEIILRELMEEY